MVVLRDSLLKKTQLAQNNVNHTKYLRIRIVIVLGKMTVGLLKKSVFDMLLMYHGKVPGETAIILSPDQACNTNNISKLGERVSLRKAAETCYPFRVLLHPAFEQPPAGIFQKHHLFHFAYP